MSGKTNSSAEDHGLFSDKLKTPDPAVPPAPESAAPQPAAKAEAAPSDKAKVASKEPKDKVIVIDDSPTILAVISGILKKTGFSTLSYRDPSLAMADLKKMSPEEIKDVKAIFSDLDMPNMTGLDVLKAIREYEPTKATPFVMITAQTERAHIQKAALLKVSGYLLKPVTTDTMIELVGNLFPERASVLKLKKAR